MSEPNVQQVKYFQSQSFEAQFQIKKKRKWQLDARALELYGNFHFGP